jgi:excisionase family DNA binding protein
MFDDQILAVRDVAALLMVEAKTLYTMVQANDLPEIKVRGQRRFRRTDIDAWIVAQVEHAKARLDDRGGDE